MSRHTVFLSLLVTAAGLSAHAEVPKVVADIAPVHGLVARVMDGVGAPALLLPAGASPHDHALRPSEARVLSEADVIFWIGPALTPWLEPRLDALAGSAERLTLLEVPGLHLIETGRHSAAGEADEDKHHVAEHHDDSDHAQHEHEDAQDHHHETDEDAHGDHAEHDHAHGDHAEHDHAHDDHAEDGHEDHAEHGHEDHDAHAEAGHDDHDHDHGPLDPHAWLDPDNSKLWLSALAERLAAVDPANGDAYLANAAAGQAEIDAAVADVRGQLGALKDTAYLVQHEAYTYFEAYFGVEGVGAIADSEAAAPGPARVSALRDAAEAVGIICVFREPQSGDALARSVAQDAGARVGELDPLGAGLDLGPGFYPALLRSLADGMTDCLAGDSAAQ